MRSELGEIREYKNSDIVVECDVLSPFAYAHCGGPVRRAGRWTHLREVNGADQHRLVP